MWTRPTADAAGRVQGELYRRAGVYFPVNCGVVPSLVL